MSWSTKVARADMDFCDRIERSWVFSVGGSLMAWIHTLHGILLCNVLDKEPIRSVTEKRGISVAVNGEKWDILNHPSVQIPQKVTSLLALAATAGAVTFDATNTASNTAGGQRFDQAVGLS
ncbi:hypothetical protein PR202_ga07425 [Eleusine coracana subsp. coracana]|uniref:DUF1618 domain-containing protein n=1 Tax=Eleusine coracana subsp. coracana TaxID=191504 RepID=A0AAV5BZ93_ELECO|nr:hypothetical protein PR202_ga07425 [Eleusine coracana subsp. coracana]